jgi:SAM-dependent methyltransferase
MTRAIQIGAMAVLAGSIPLGPVHLALPTNAVVAAQRRPTTPIGQDRSQLPGGPARSRGRLFSPQDLGLLEGPDRDQWQKPDQIMDALGIADGSVVADIGAAGGWFTVRLARRVGPNGRVYAEDIQRAMIEAIARRVQRESLTNVTSVLGTVTDPRLPPGLDAALIVETYGEMADPVALLRAIAKSLKPQGRIGIVDFNAGAGGPGPAPEQRIDPEIIIRTAGAAGLHLIAREALPPFQFLLVLGRNPGGG